MRSAARDWIWRRLLFTPALADARGDDFELRSYSREPELEGDGARPRVHAEAALMALACAVSSGTGPMLSPKCGGAGRHALEQVFCVRRFPGLGFDAGID